MKRRCFCLFMIFIFIFLFFVPVYAIDLTEYELEELGLTISMPSDYAVFTRDLDDAVEELSKFGLTKEKMLSNMNENKIYLDGWDEKISQEIVITMAESSLVDFNLFSDMEITTLASSLEKGYVSLGVTVLKTEIYEHSQAKFLKVYFSQPKDSGTIHGLQYYTVYDNKAINITLHSYSGTISSSQETIIKEVVDSAHFDTEPQLQETEIEPTSEFTYTDSKTQSTFVVPANWIETALSTERKSIDVKFMSQIDEGMCIMYGSRDVWSEMSEADKRGLVRADIDNNYFTKSDFAELFGLSVDEIHQITYNGKEFFIATIEASVDTLGVNISVSITHALLINDGYLYWFQFSGTQDNKLYSDYESVLSSLTLPNQASQTTDTNNTDTQSTSSRIRSTDTSSKKNNDALILNLLLTITIYSVPIIVYRYAIRKTPVPKKKAKLITAIYGILAFVATIIIISIVGGSGTTGGAILLWSWVNYRVLIEGKVESKMPQNPSEENVEPDLEHTNTSSDHVENVASAETAQTTHNICPVCGAEIAAESKFCSNCGTKIKTDEEM